MARRDLAELEYCPILDDVDGGITGEEVERRRQENLLPVHKLALRGEREGKVTQTDASNIFPEQGRVFIRRELRGGGVVRGSRVHKRTGVFVGRGIAEVTNPTGVRVVIAWNEAKNSGVVIDASDVPPGRVDRLGVDDPSAHYQTTFRNQARAYYVDGGAATLSAVRQTFRRAKRSSRPWRQVGRNVLARRDIVRSRRRRTSRRRRRTWADIPTE